MKYAQAAFACLLLVSFTTPANAQDADPEPALGSDDAGIRVVGTRDLLGASPDSLVYVVLRAFSPRQKKPAKSYDIWEAREFARELGRFFRAAPPRQASAAPRPSAATTAEREVLQTELDRCSESRASDVCSAVIGGTDYENVLGDAPVMPVSAQKAWLAKKIDPASKVLLEVALTRLLERIRVHVNSASATPLKPVRVVIGPRGNLNIGAVHGSDTLTVPEDVLRDIVVRVIFRATYTIRQLSSELDFYEDCFDCDGIMGEFNIFSVNMPRYAYVASQLPGMRFRHLRPTWFADAVRKGCAPLRPGLGEALDALAADGGVDLREEIPEQELRSLASCATDGTTRLSEGDIDAYIREGDTMAAFGSSDEEDAGFDEVEDGFDAYFPLLLENTTLNAVVAGELAKSLLFILAHEGHHIWVSPDAGPNAEFAADAHAVQVYLALAPEMDPDQWFRSVGLTEGLPTNQSGQPAPNYSAQFRSMLGRDPGVLLREIYRGTRFYDGAWSHPPVEQRVARIVQDIEAGRLAYTCDMIKETIRQAEAAQMPPLVDSSACTT